MADDYLSWSWRENNEDARMERKRSRRRKGDLEMQRSPDRQSKSPNYEFTADRLNSVRNTPGLLTKPAPKPTEQQPYPFSKFEQFLEEIPEA